VYYANERGQILSVDFHNMNVFRKTTLYKIIEETRDWKYKVPGVRSRGDHSQLQGSNSRKAAGLSSNDDKSRSQTPNSLSGKKGG
jgi:hypothetical protein